MGSRGQDGEQKHGPEDIYLHVKHQRAENSLIHLADAEFRRCLSATQNFHASIGSSFQFDL